jgi:threonine/homoserine/homoserine lactone efflux protein
MHGNPLTFFAVIIMLTVTPGADMALVSRRVLGNGMRSVLPTLAGIFSGLCVHVTLCVAGISLLIARSHLAFTTLRIAGACYLMWLGVQSLLEARRTRAAAAAARAAGTEVEAPDVDRGAWRRWYVQGLFTNVLNVKVALFYTAFLPQFASPGPGFALRAVGLALVQFAIGFAWLLVWATFVRKAAGAAERPRLKVIVERVTGCALVAFGVRLAAG